MVNGKSRRGYKEEMVPFFSIGRFSTCAWIAVSFIDVPVLDV